MSHSRRVPPLHVPLPTLAAARNVQFVKPVGEFDWKDRKKEYRRSWCRDCWKAYQRDRWLSVEKTVNGQFVVPGGGKVKVPTLRSCC